ncbi:hypothetical protein GCM10010340_70340 [Streptomyces griseoloalbus]|nr:hypothetical protein GCM10010340_70340 [Streptomyces albaduncus]
MLLLGGTGAGRRRVLATWARAGRRGRFGRAALAEDLVVVEQSGSGGRLWEAGPGRWRWAGYRAEANPANFLLGR